MEYWGHRRLVAEWTRDGSARRTARTRKGDTRHATGPAGHRPRRSPVRDGCSPFG